MQILKEEIRNQILDSAETLFLEHGFAGTTTRMIANQVGISVSNLYLYYENKEALFYAITDPFYQNFTQDFGSFLGHIEETNDMGERMNQAIIRMIILNRRKFLLVLEKSKGTKYESFKKSLVEELKNHIQSQMNCKYENKEILALVFAKGLVEGIVIIAKEHKDMEQLKYSLKCLTDYHVDGIKRYLK